jgi:hypothetical protein
MLIHNAVITGSFSYNGADLSNVTSSNQSSASLSTRVTQIEQVYATTGSNSFRATQSITGSLTVTGQIIAQTLNVQQVTSSIVFSSGSNNFGCDLNSRQTFTGSFYQTGSIACFSNTLFGNTINGNSALISGSGTFGTCMTNGDFTIISNSSPFLIKGRQTYDRGFLGLTWDVSPDVGVMLGNSLGFNTNSIPGSTIGTRALTLACNGAATFASSVTANGVMSLGDDGTYGSTYKTLGFTGNTNGTHRILAGTADDMYIAAATARGIYFWTDGSTATRMRILPNGNVGIGTSTPSRKLTVVNSDNGFSAGISGTAFGLRFDNGGSFAFGGSTIHGVDNTLTTTYQILGLNGSEIIFGTGGTERMRLNPSGFLFVGTTTNSGFTNAHRIKGPTATENEQIISIDGGVEYSGFFRAVSGANYNGAGTGIQIGRNTSTLRSINAGGTINASGADYAEYMLKATEDTIAKGDIVGVNSQGKLTNIFEESISFVVKSTNPSYVGGDTWGNNEAIGKEPIKEDDQTEEEYEQLKTEYQVKLEEARTKVDRIAFSGQVPCNVTGATVGDYIVPIELENGKIGGQAVSNPTLEQYRISVGKVWKIMEDGRAWIAVKIG